MSPVLKDATHLPPSSPGCCATPPAYTHDDESLQGPSQAKVACWPRGETLQRSSRSPCIKSAAGDRVREYNRSCAAPSQLFWLTKRINQDRTLNN